MTGAPSTEGAITELGIPSIWSDTRPELRRHAPTLGEPSHSVYVRGPDRHLLELMSEDAASRWTRGVKRGSSVA